MITATLRGAAPDHRQWLPWMVSLAAHAGLALLLAFLGQLDRAETRRQPISVAVRAQAAHVVAQPVVAKAPVPKPAPPKPKPPVKPTQAASVEPAPQKGDPSVAPVFGVRKDAVRLGGAFKVSVGNTLAADPSARGPLVSDAEPGSPDGTGIGSRPVSLAQVTQMPRVARAARPSYPEQLRRLGTEGVVRVEIVIDATGAVVDARVVASPEPAFNEAALEAARKTVFVPARAGDEPVAIRLQIPVEFRLTD